MSEGSPPRRVVVTGLGLLSSLGWGRHQHLEQLRGAESGVVAMAEWEARGLRSRFGAPICAEALGAARAESDVPRRQLQTMGPLAEQAVLAAEEAMRDAALTPELRHRRDTVCILGAGVGSMPAIYEGARLVYAGKARRVRPFSLLQSMSSAPSAHVTQALGIGGRSYTLASACASSAHAIGHSFELIRSGAATLAVTGGAEELNVIVAAAFEALRGALSSERHDAHRACLPFDAQRSGLVLGAAAGVLILEERSAALQRGARIWGEVLGFGANSQAHDLVQPEPTGAAAADCMRQALAAASLLPRDISSINAHATGTSAGDLAEARAISEVFASGGPGASEATGGAPPWVASTKALTGHTLGAAGGLEAGFCLLMLRHGFLAGMGFEPAGEDAMPALRWVPAGGLATTDPSLSARSAAAGPQRSVHLCNSFGFGGTNASLVLAEHH